MVDFASVIAGPACGRMFAELGATVISSDPINPQHSPLIMTTWVAELGVGKRSIILDVNTEEGRQILNQLLSRADMFMNNGLDPSFKRLRLDPASLAKTDGMSWVQHETKSLFRRDRPCPPWEGG